MFKTERLRYPIGDNGLVITRFEQCSKSAAYPAGVRFAVMGFVLIDGAKHQIIRIDNTPHHGIPNTHIHYLEKREVIFRRLNYSQARTFVEECLKRH